MKSPGRFDYLIVGAGFAGLSTAYYLAKKGAGSVCLLEKEASFGMEASGKNASMMRQITGDPAITLMAVEGTRLLKKELSQTGRERLFEPRGSLLLASESRFRRLEASIQVALSHRINLKILNASEARRRFPLLEKTSFERAIWNPEDGIIPMHELSEYLFEKVRDKAVHFKALTPVKLKRLENGLYETQTNDGKIQASVVVNAAGAWADQVAQNAGAEPLGLKCYRRHIFVSEALDQVSPQDPFIWHLDQDIYCRPENKTLLFSPCDATLMTPGDSPVDNKVEMFLRKKIQTFLPDLADIRFERSWAGLRTFSTDGKFIIGFDQKISNFFWVAALGGHGLTTALAVGRQAAQQLQSGSGTLAAAIGVRYLSKP